MVSDELNKEASQRKNLEKWEPRLNSLDDVYFIVDQAFEYRGDVTIRLKSGLELIGYIFNRVPEAPEPYFEYWPRNEERTAKVCYKDVAGLIFSGVNAAAGRSWEAWMKRVEEKKKAEAEGRHIGDIEPTVMPLDDR